MRPSTGDPALPRPIDLAAVRQRCANVILVGAGRNGTSLSGRAETSRGFARAGAAAPILCHVGLDSPRGSQILEPSVDREFLADR